MSPEPLIELQRRLSLVGAIRAGGQKPERGVGRKLENWRITSPRKQLIEQAAELYGGEVSEWTSPVGKEWQVYTSVSELPVLLMPAYSLRQTYELWEGATKRTRLCDGVDEEITGQPCICNTEGVDKCDLYTRLVVALPELDTLLGWRVITRGANAAHELPTMVEAARRATSATFVPARLHLEQRRGVVEGQVARFVVPTLDLGVGYAALTAAAASASAEQLIARDAPALAAAADQEPDVANPAGEGAAQSSRPRGAAAFGPESISPEEATAPTVPTNGGEGEQTRAASDAQKKKLNVLVGQLREAGLVNTEGIYDAVATRLRGTAGADLAATLEAYDDGGLIHWSPLREDLTRVEANTLIDWLEKAQARVAQMAEAGSQDEQMHSDAEAERAASVSSQKLDAAQAEGEQQDGEAAMTVVEEVEEEEPQHIQVPYNEFPPGY